MKAIITVFDIDFLYFDISLVLMHPSVAGAAKTAWDENDPYKTLNDQKPKLKKDKNRFANECCSSEMNGNKSDTH